MNIHLQTTTCDVPLTVANDRFATADIACPSCRQQPTLVYGNGRRETDRGHEADGFCGGCHEALGTIRADYETIFGVQEDAACIAEIEERGGRVYSGRDGRGAVGV